MNDQKQQQTPANPASSNQPATDTVTGANPTTRQRRSVSLVWLIPLVTLIVGIWMLYDYWQLRGHSIQITFENAEGLEAGKTPVKYRNVPIGQIDSIVFNASRDRVIANVLIDNDMGDLLTEDSKFWVVKPRIGKQGVSGIGTLLSGAFIEMSPGTSNTTSKRFSGLETPPTSSSGQQGLRLELTSKGGKPLSPGDPVIYRGFTVGEVENFEFETDLRQAKYGIFIRSPYDNLITTNTFFWNAGGMTVETNVEGIKVNMASIEALLSGGIQFDIPKDLPLGKRVTKTRRYTLYKDEASIYEEREYQFLQYVLLVKGSIAGLYAGAPVRYQGIRIGMVETPYMTRSEVIKLTGEPLKDRLAVKIHIEPERLYGELTDITLEEFAQQFEHQIKSGLVATLESPNPLLGSLMVNLDMSGKPVASLETFGTYTVIPSARGSLDSMVVKVDSILDKVNGLPLDTTVANLNKALASADTLLNSINDTVDSTRNLLNGVDTGKISRSIEASLLELRQAIKGLTPDSSLYSQTEKTMNKLQQALDGIKPLFNDLRKQPSKLFFSDPHPADTEPPAKR